MHRDSFDLKWRLKNTIGFLLDTPSRKSTLPYISKAIRTDENLFRSEIVTQIWKYPAFSYNPNDDSLELSLETVPIFLVIRHAFEELKESFFLSNRFETKIYEIGARSKSTNAFWDVIESLVYSSDFLSGFWLENLVGIATTKYGPLGSTTFDNTIHWRATIPLHKNSSEESLIRLNWGNPDINTSLSFMRKNSTFVKDLMELPFLKKSEILLLESLEVVSFERDSQLYHLKLPLIYPWNLNYSRFKFRMEEDYCRRIFRELDLRISNPINAEDVSKLFQKLVHDAREDQEDNADSDFDVFTKLEDFSNNVQSIVYSEGLQSNEFEKRIAFPVSMNDANVLGEILWTLEDIPDVIQLMPFEWLKALVRSAVDNTRLLRTQTSNPSLAGDAVVFLTSSNVAEKLCAVIENKGMKPSTRYDYSGQVVVINKLRDMKRLGIVPEEPPAQEQYGTSARGIIREILDNVLKNTSRHHANIIGLDELSKRIEVGIGFLRRFIQNHFGRSLDLESYPGYVTPEEDPLLRIDT